MGQCGIQFMGQSGSAVGRSFAWGFPLYRPEGTAGAGFRVAWTWAARVFG